MRRHIQYLKYVVQHKWFVFLGCLKMGVPLWIAIFHDWDKFLPDEWIPYAHTFYNKDGSKTYKEYPDFALAWNYHQKRNKHHWQYWILTWDRGESEALPMPELYVREMLADWIGAGRAITGESNPEKWYEDNKQKMILHPETRILIERLMPVAQG